MQTDDRPESLRAFDALDTHPQQRVLHAIFAALEEHKATGDPAVLEQMSRDVAFSLRIQKSERYQKLVENGPREPSRHGRTVSEVLADLGR